MKQIKHTFEEKKKMGGKASMWNLWHGCHKWSEGCRHCYVYRTDGKYGKDSSVVTKTEKFGLPLQKKKNGEYKIPSGNLVYTCFTSDFLIEDADEWRAEAWEMMRIRQDLHFMFITKRIDIPKILWPRLRLSWQRRRHHMITGRMDFCMDERGLKVYEYNAHPCRNPYDR